MSRPVKHGMANSRLYVVWCAMKERCNNPKYKDYKYYGGRGIKVCQEWQDFESFYKWSMTAGYDENAPRGVTTIDRINNDGNYEPSNCRWVSMQEQCRNRRRPAKRKGVN